MDIMINFWFKEPRQGRDLGSGPSAHESYQGLVLNLSERTLGKKT